MAKCVVLLGGSCGRRATGRHGHAYADVPHPRSRSWFRDSDRKYDVIIAPFRRFAATSGGWRYRDRVNNRLLLVGSYLVIQEDPNFQIQEGAVGGRMRIADTTMLARSICSKLGKKRQSGR